MSVTTVLLSYTVQKSLLSANAMKAMVMAVSLTSNDPILNALKAVISSDMTTIIDPTTIKRSIALDFDDATTIFTTNAEKISICRHLYQGILNAGIGAAFTSAEPTI